MGCDIVWTFKQASPLGEPAMPCLPFEQSIELKRAKNLD